MQQKKEETQKEETPPIITSLTATEIETEFEDREKENQERVEAALFISGKFLNLQELITLTDINPIMLKELLNRLEKKYSKGVIRIIVRNNSWKMDVDEKYHYMINKLASGSVEFSKAEQETLAVLAYKQPVKQSIIIKIRGNKAYEHIKKFSEVGLLTAKPSGHTKILSLSEDFYDYFNVHKKEQEDNLSEKQELSEQETEQTPNQNHLNPIKQGE